jgi:FTR1 family protein
MLPTFVIGLREGIEAALVVGIIAAFLNQEGRKDALKWTWLGVGLATAICLAVGIALQVVDQELPQRQQEMLETVIGALAVGLVTWMIFWMRRNARGLAGSLRQSTKDALAQGSVGALVGMAFFAVLREGMETAVFLLAAFQSAANPTTAGAGAALGIAVAIAIGFAIYRGGVRLNLQKFFRLTGLVLVLVAAGLVSNSLHTAHEAGWINFGQSQTFDLSWLVVPGSWTSSLLTGMLGFQPFPVHTEFFGYLLYLLAMLAFVLWPAGKRIPGVRLRHASTAALVLLALLVLAACGSADTAPAGARQVAVKLTDAGCEPASLKLAAGQTTFTITNAGTGRVSEFEVLDGSRILGEKEHLVAGLSGSFTLNLEPGTYALSCPGGKSAATGELRVAGGSAASSGSDPLLAAATKSYASYVDTQVAELLKRVTPFVAAVKAGDVERAKSLFAAARAPYETIEPVAESFGNLDPEIDARVNDVAKGATWTGFHRIEQGLWKHGSTKGMTPIADKLLADVKRLGSKTTGLSYKPEELANGANGLLGEVSASKITGEEDRYSHTDLSDFEANVTGAETAFGLLAPALRKRDAALATRIGKAFDTVQAELASLKRGDAFPSYDTVGQAERRKLSRLVDALAEPLSQVAAKLAG